jgi:ubiquinone/menaquinone biosynthesis C-methylase UbiE
MWMMASLAIGFYLPGKAIGGHFAFKDGTLDLVTDNMVIEHVVDPVNFLKDICRVLRPEGCFLSVSPHITPMPAVSRLVPEMIKKRAVHFLERLPTSLQPGTE